MAECNDTFDCFSIRDNGDRINRVCFEEAGVNNTGICDCDNYYGYVGEFCDERTIQTVWIFFYTIFHVVGSTIGIAVIAYLAYKFSTLDERFQQSNRILVWTLLFSFLSFGFELMNSIGHLVAASDQKFMQHVSYQDFDGDEETVFGPFGVGTIFNLFFIIFFFCLVCMCMMFLWLNVIQRTNEMVDVKMFKKINTFKLIVKIVVGVTSLLAVALMLANFLIVAMLLSIFFVIPTVILTWRARVLFIKGIKDSNQSGQAMEIVIARIRSYSFMLATTLSIMAFAFLIYGSVGYDAIENQRPGGLLVAEMPLQITAILKTVALLNTLRFIDFIMKNMASNTKTKSKTTEVGTSRLD